MIAYIEHSRLTHHYYVKLDSRRAPVLENRAFTRKDEAERFAKQNGATEIEWRERNVTDDLVKHLGLERETAKRLTKEFYS